MNTTLTFRKERRDKDTYGLLFVKLGEPSPSSVGFPFFSQPGERTPLVLLSSKSSKKTRGTKEKRGKKNKGEKRIQREREKREGDTDIETNRERHTQTHPHTGTHTQTHTLQGNILTSLAISRYH